MEKNVLIWTCIFVFVATSIITLLGIINRITIDKRYLNALFSALILEIVSIGIMAFKSSIPSPTNPDFLKITMPDPGFSYSTDSGRSLFIKGAYLKQAEHTLKGELRTNDSIEPLTNISKNDNIFLYSLEPDMLKSQKDATIYLSIADDKKVIAKDSIHIKID